MKPVSRAMIDIGLVFAVALTLRCLFNFGLDHRVCQFGDAYYYLNAGSQLLLALQHGGFGALMHCKAAAAGIQAMTSTCLVDRLLLDGPMFPSYLALAQFVLGIQSALPQFDGHALQLSLFNSVLDSLSCVLLYAAGRLSYNRTAGLVAGLLLATYPPAIINTAVCYSEQFAYFLLLSWATTLLAINCRIFSNGRLALFGVAGILSASLVLAKPVFVLLPPLAALMLIPRIGSRFRWKPAISALACFVVGFSVLALPWLCFTAQAAGKPTLLVNRAPAFNLFIGNDLQTDGFRVYPLPYTPSETPEAVSLLKAQFTHNPLAFGGMELRKISRLWAGAWNTFNYTFILTPRGQDVWHQFLLFAAAVGAAAAITANGFNSGRGRATALAAGVILCHFAYAAFEPISRYAITAIPFVCLLAAYAFTKAVPKGNRRSLYINSLLIALTFFIAKRAFASICPFVSFIQMSPDALSLVNCTFWVVAWTAVCVLVWKASLGAGFAHRTTAGKLTSCVLAALALITAGTLTSTALGNLQTVEWACAPRPGDVLRRTVCIPSSTRGEFYVLADIATSETAPALQVTVNGMEAGQPLPWWQAAEGNEELVKALSVEASAAGTNIQSYRQWWLFPVDAGAVHVDGNNVIDLSTKIGAPQGSTIVFGSFCTKDRVRVLPSLQTTSWTKAFASIDRGDARLPSRIALSSLSSSCEFRSSSMTSSEDLSWAPGKQAGEYHLLLLSTPTQAASTGTSSNVLTVRSHTARGSYPPSFFVPEATLPKVAPRSRLVVSATAFADRRIQAAFQLSVKGTSNRAPVEWTSPWHPGYVNIDKSPRAVSFSDVLPDTIAGAENAHASLLVSPFPAEWIFVRQKQATKQTMDLSDLNMTVAPPVSLSARNAQLY